MIVLSRFSKNHWSSLYCKMLQQHLFFAFQHPQLKSARIFSTFRELVFMYTKDDCKLLALISQSIGLPEDLPEDRELLFRIFSAIADHHPERTADKGELTHLVKPLFSCIRPVQNRSSPYLSPFPITYTFIIVAWAQIVKRIVDISDLPCYTKNEIIRKEAPHD